MDAIANKDILLAFIIKLLVELTGYMCISNTTKYTKIFNRSCSTTLYLIRSLKLKTFGWTPIQKIDCIYNNFCPELLWHMFCLQHAKNHIYNSLILPFSQPILLMCISRNQLMLDTYLLEEVITCQIFCTLINMKNFYLLPILSFYIGFEIL